MRTKAKSKGQLKWKQLGNRQQEAVSLNRKYDFVIDARNEIILLIFNHRIKDKNKAYIDSMEYDTIRDAKEDAENWK